MACVATGISYSIRGTYFLENFIRISNMRGHYSERWKLINLDGHPLLVYETSDLSDSELLQFYRTAIEGENYEYCAALEAEANSRGLTLVKSIK